MKPLVGGIGGGGFCTSQVICNIWQINISKGFIVFSSKDDDVQV